MLNVDFEKLDSLYKFKCFLGICVICIPQVFMYFLSSESLAKSYFLIYKSSKCVFSILILVLLISIIFGMYLIYTGLNDWRVKQQNYLDRKLQQDVRLISANLDEINKKIESKFIDDAIVETKIDNCRRKEKSVEMIRNNFEQKEKSFLEYLNNSLKKRYAIYSNIKLNIGGRFNNREIVICDAVAVSNSNDKDIIYEIKFGAGAPKSTIYQIEALKRLISVYIENYQRQCIGQLAYILNKEEKSNLSDSFFKQINSDYYNLVEIKIYDYEDIQKHVV